MRRYVPADLDQLIERLSLEAETDRVAAHAWTDSETIAVVDHYLASLDEQSRRIHDALYVQGLSQREAAELLGLGRQVVRTQEAKLAAGCAWRYHARRASAPCPSGSANRTVSRFPNPPAGVLRIGP